MKRLLTCLMILILGTTPALAEIGVVANTQNSFVIPWVATDRSDFKTAETALTAGTFVVSAFKRNKLPETITISACVFATSTLTSDATAPSNNDTLTIAGTLNGSAVSRVYTYKTTLTGAANEILIGASAAAALDNTKSAINATAGAGTTYGTGTLINELVNATTNTDTTQVIVANIPGTGPNAYTTTEASTHLSWTGGTLASGNDSCMSHYSVGRYWFAGAASLYDTAGPLTLTFNYDAEALPFEVLLDVMGQTSFNARYVSVASTDDQSEVDCSTIANTNSPLYKACTYLTGEVVRWIAKGTADSGTTTTLVDTERTEASSRAFVPGMVVFTSGDLLGQFASITAFTPGTDTITFSPAVSQAVTTETYEIWPVPDFLRPATSGRTLVVDGAGLADANMVKVGPTGSGTAQTSGDIMGDTNDIQTRLPAALGANGNIKADVRDYNGTAGTFSGGRPEVNTTHAAGTAWNSGAIGPNTLAADTITAAKVASDFSTELWGTTFSELSQATPSATPSAANAVMLLYMALRNRLEVTATEKRITNDAGTVITKKTLSDNGTTYVETEATAGP